MADVFETSYLRGNIVAWLPIKKTDAVLYRGKSSDMAAKKLKERSDALTCAEDIRTLPKEKNFDFVICFGDADAETIQMCAAYVKADGHLILAVENAYGLKYLAGVKEIGSLEYFGAVEALNGSKGVTKEALQAELAAAGFLSMEFYYPFPDYYFTMSLYSDAYLPKQGELIDQIGNFDEERLLLFDEAKAMDAAVMRGKFREFSNSYLVAASKKADSYLQTSRGEQICFVKFSNDRGSSHNIQTHITKSNDGKMHLLKLPDSEKAAGQILNLEKTAKELQNMYAKSRFLVNRCTMREDAAELEFLQGHTLEEEMDRLLEKGEYEKAKERFAEVFAEIRSCPWLEFSMTEEFKKIFGNVDLPEGLQAVPTADIDMILSNILVQKKEQKPFLEQTAESRNKNWTIIDYEWSFHFPMPVNFMIYRAIHYYAETTAERRALDAAQLYADAGLSKQELKVYEQMEQAFQSYVLENHVPMRLRYKEAGKPAYHLSSLLHLKSEIEHTRCMQVYFDRGSGTREEDSRKFHSPSLDGEFHLEIPIDSDVTAIRIDPAAQACTAEIERLGFLGGKESIVPFYGPVHKMGERMYLFEGKDPFLLITELPDGERKLRIDMRVETMSPAAAKQLALKIDWKYRIKQKLNR